MDPRLPKTDSSTGRGIKTALQTFIGFIVGLAIAVWQVPGVPDAIQTYISQNFGTVLLTVGLPVALSSGLTSFLYNLIFRNSVKTY